MASENSQQCSLADLPTGTLAHVSSYLHPLSRALFAAALDYHDPDSRMTIIGDHWERTGILDFGEIERDLATKLSDDDIRGVLLAIKFITSRYCGLLIVSISPAQVWSRYGGLQS